MKIDPKKIQYNLPFDVEYFDEIDSTSLYLICKIKEKKPVPGLVIADMQTNGQGRVGKSFYSPASTGLYLTFCFSKNEFLCDHITPRIALAVSKSILSSLGIDCGLKWVNDIYLNGKKVAGVLCQSVEEYFLFGIGINILCPETVPEKLKKRLGYLLDACSVDLCQELIVSLYKNIFDIAKVKTPDLLKSYREHCVHIGKEIEIQKDSRFFSGVCVGIDDDFSLLVDIDGEVSRFSSGYMKLKI